MESSFTGLRIEGLGCSRSMVWNVLSLPIRLPSGVTSKQLDPEVLRSIELSVHDWY